MRCIGYIRASTGQQGLSIEAQKSLIENFYRSNKFEQIKFYIDEGLSGKTEIEERPGLMKLIVNLRKEDTVVVQKRDRLARDLIICTMIERTIRKTGAKLISLAGEGSEIEGPGGDFIRAIFDAFSQLERAMIQQRTITILRNKRENNEKCGTIPYGKQLSSDGKHLEINAYESKAIQKMIEWRNKGMTFLEISRMLDQNGLHNRKGKEGKGWNSSNVRKLIIKLNNKNI